MFDHAAIFIPAFQQGQKFQNDLLRKLDGVSLIQRAIDKAMLLGCDPTSIHLLTNNEEVALVGKRNHGDVYLGGRPISDSSEIDSDLRHYVEKAEQGKDFSVLLSPYAPMIGISTLLRATESFVESKFDVLKLVRMVNRSLLDRDTVPLTNALSNSFEVQKIDCRAFTLLRPGRLLRKNDIDGSVLEWVVGDDAFEIDTLQDWWVSEKLLQRRRIVFRVIGNNRVGMGHIYRTLALAHELHDHEILFVTDVDNREAVETIVRSDYWLGIYSSSNMINEIIQLQPDMVINDILDTQKDDIQKLRSAGIMVVSFEDLGSGARYTNLTVNEIYDVPKFEATHVLWGNEYFFLRDEFQAARPHSFKEKIDSIMVAFGGTDQHDLARKSFYITKTICDELEIFLHIVTGPGYRGYDQLKREIRGNNNVSLTHASEVISSLMEQTQVAITSNGRTVYEFAHMNIPAIVIAQHQREVTHAFASEENGFLPLGLYQEGETELILEEALKKLVLNTGYRKELYNRLLEHRFVENKDKVVSRLQQILRQETVAKVA